MNFNRYQMKSKPTQTLVVPDKIVWPEKIVNRTIEWGIDPVHGLYYTVVGERSNCQDLVIKPECRRKVLFQGNKSVYTPDDGMLRDLADVWHGSVLLPTGELYKSPTHDHVWDTENSGHPERDFPYFKHD